MSDRGGISSAAVAGDGASIGASRERQTCARQPAAVRAAPVESWTITEADVDAWLSHARQGDVLVYAHGPSLIQGAAAARIRALIEARDVLALPQRRVADGGFDYRVVRHRVRVVTERAPVCDPNMLAVLTELQDDAQRGRRCRSDDELGEATGLSANQVKWQLKKLEAAGMIERRTLHVAGDAKFRVVKVIATGMETRGPE